MANAKNIKPGRNYSEKIASNSEYLGTWHSPNKLAVISLLRDKQI